LQRDAVRELPAETPGERAPTAFRQRARRPARGIGSDRGEWHRECGDSRMIWRGCGRQPSLHGGTRWQDAAGAGGLWSPAVDPRRFSPMRTRQTIACALVALVTLLVTSRAGALPVELKDQNGTKYQINTDVSPLLRNSEASGALTNATYVKPVTVTSYF